MTTARSEFPSSVPADRDEDTAASRASVATPIPGRLARPVTNSVLVNPGASVPAGVDPARRNPVPPNRAPVTRMADYRHVAPARRPVMPMGRPAAQAAPPAPVVRRPALSPREIEVLLAWLEADSKEDAAERLFIAASTVSTHLARIRAKYTAVGRPAPTKTHLLARALQDGITRLEDW